MTPTNMLELQKLVLENVYESKPLFTKELQKSFQWLNHDELINLQKWVIGRFYDQYSNIINCLFVNFD